MLKEPPVFSVIEKKRCTGCECCASVCPMGCIHMCADEEGFLFPSFDSEKCVNCGKCIKYCPVCSSSITGQQFSDIYIGFAKSQSIVVDSASGGMFSLLVDAFMSISENRGYVCGVVWDSDFKRTVHIISSSMDEIKRMRSSKYIQSYKGDIYKNTKALLDQGSYVLFSGTPCECVALKSYLGRDYDKLYIIDIVCQGPTSPLAMNQYIDHITKGGKHKISSVNMRYVHKTPWIPQWLKIEFNNRKPYIKLFYETEIGRAVHIMQRLSCYSCQFNGNNRVSDITMGDNHGANPDDQVYNPYGTSILLINNERGRLLFDLIRDHSVLDHADPNSIIGNNPRINTPGVPHRYRRSFSNDFETEGLFTAARNSWTIRQRIRSIIPYDVRMAVRRMRKAQRKG